MSCLLLLKSGVRKEESLVVINEVGETMMGGAELSGLVGIKMCIDPTRSLTLAHKMRNKSLICVCGSYARIAYILIEYKTFRL